MEGVYYSIIIQYYNGRGYKENKGYQQGKCMGKLHNVVALVIFSAIMATMAAPTMRECLIMPTDKLDAMCAGINSFNVQHTLG